MAADEIEAHAQYVYYHDCPALGPHTIVPRALIADPNGEIVLAYQHKGPFCGQTAGEKELAPGVTELVDGRYEVDMTKAERMRGSDARPAA